MPRLCVTRRHLGLVLISFLTSGACDGHTPNEASPAALAAVTSGAAAPADTSNATRATADAAGAKRFRAIAEAQRQLAVAYGKWSAASDGKVTTDWNEKLKASAISRAAAADQVAGRYQSRADFHLAEAAKEASR